MPEGPEVETIRTGLLPVVGCTITKVQVADHKKYIPYHSKIKGLKDTIIDRIERKGKFLVWYFRNRSSVQAALNHLGMTGLWFHYSDESWQEFDDPFSEYKHWKVYFRLNDGSHLLFINVRTFGRFEVYSPEEIDEHPSIKNLGPDILDTNFDTDEFIKRMRGKGSRNRTKEVGKCLLDYTIVSGCGNIYKSEALFLSSIHPMTPANELDEEQLHVLADSLCNVAHMALKFKGSTLRDYRHVDGYSGLMQNEFSVYDKDGKPCVVCNTEIISDKQGGRTSFWCPSCQNNFDYDS